MVTLGKALREIRTEQRLSLTALASRMMATKQLISRWETKGGEMTIKSLLCWCEAVGVKPSEVLHRAELLREKPSEPHSEVVRVYRNLHKKTPEGLPVYSVQTKSPKRGWRLSKHAHTVLLSNPTFVVQQSGRQRALREGQKNVHAFVCGQEISDLSTLSELTKGLTALAVTYTPQRGCFFQKDTLQSVESAKFALIGADGVTLYL